MILRQLRVDSLFQFAYCSILQGVQVGAGSLGVRCPFLWQWSDGGQTLFLFAAGAQKIAFKNWPDSIAKLLTFVSHIN